MRRQYAGEMHAVGLKSLDDLAGGISGVDDDGFTARRSPIR